MSDDRSTNRDVKHRILSKRSSRAGFNRAFNIAWALFAILFVSVAVSVTFYSGDALHAEEAAGLLIFLAIGVVPLVLTLRRRRTRPQYGPTLVELFEDPVAPGGHLVGHAVTDLQIAPREGFLTRLSYLENTSAGDESQTISRLWSDEHRVAALSTPEHGSSVVVPVAFKLPGDLPPRWNTRRDRTFWRLSVGAELPDGRFADSISVPVQVHDEEGRHTHSRESVAAGSEAETDFVATTNSELYNRLKSHRLPPRKGPLRPGLELHEGPGRFELRITPEYYRDQLRTGLLWTFGFAGIAAFMVHIGSCAWLLVPVFGFIAYKSGAATVSTWRRATSITVEDDAVVLRSGRPGRLQERRRIPTVEIEAIEVAPIVPEVNTPRFGGNFEFLIHLRGEHDVRLAGPQPFDDKEEALRLAAKLAAATDVSLANSV